jgi:hypothetical protein
MNRLLRFILVFAALFVVETIVCANNVSAQAKPAQAANEFLMATAVGDLAVHATPNTARIHLQGSLGLQTADYFRGRFDGVKERAEDWGVLNHLAVVAELWKDQKGPIQNLNFIVGIENGAAEAGMFPNDREPRIWYEANPYLGFAMRLSRDLLLGATFTSYTSPNGFLGTSEEIALTAKYQGTQYFMEKLNPQVKVAVPVTDGKGLYAEFSLTPTIMALPDLGLSLEFPLVGGVGFNDYYEGDDDTLAFGSIGIVARIPISSLNSPYGNWSAFAGAHVIFRQSALSRIYVGLDDANDTVVYGNIGVNLAF